MPIAPDYLITLQNKPEAIRNICILAHVDHGKTSLSDNLLASNGIISQSMQGKIRYLDSRPDEQARGITMESSAISLYFKVLKKIEEQEQPVAKEYLINLIDSPGHIDFSSEVSTASRLCDGAVVVVDAVEGVCSQTVTVLRQAWNEKMKPVLVINKIDRLITELQLTPLEAFHHLTRLIEQVNAVVGTFFQGQRMEEDLKWRERLEANKNEEEFIETSDEDLYFAPERNNVVFGSAVDGWGFNISQFAAIYARKWGIDRSKLEKVLWGENYMDPKTKKVFQGANKVKGKNLKPMFVSLVLENIWAVYNSCVIDRNPELTEKIVNALGLKVQPRDLRNKDGRGLMLSIFNQWIPLSRAILLSVVEVLPSPLEAQRDRMQMILEGTPSYQSIEKSVSDSMKECDKTGPLTAFVSKVVAYSEKDIPKEKKQQVDRIAEIREKSAKARELAMGDIPPLENDNDDSLEKAVGNMDISRNDEKLIGFARVYSGTLKVGQTVTILNPKYDPANPNSQHYKPVEITGLFLLMGRDMIVIDEAPAGNIVGIGGLDGKILKSGTLVSSKVYGPNLAATNVAAPPILRVAIEPVNPIHIPQVEHGLELLNISDPCVQVSILETGEMILATAGELHLERCVKDLKERYAKVDIHCSPPIVPYRETIVDDGSEWVRDEEEDDKDDDDDEEEERNDGELLERGEVIVNAGNLRIKFQVYPLSKEVTKCIGNNTDKIRGLIIKKEDLEEEVVGAVERDNKKLIELQNELDSLLTKNKSDSIVAFGPRKVGPNILFDSTGGKIGRRVFLSEENTRSTFEENILTGFQMAVSRGDLMAEPLEGVGCVICEITENEQESSGGGRIFTLIRDAIHKGIRHWPPRVMLAQYLCDIQAPGEVLGKVYGVVTKRRGKILNEEMREGAHFYTVTASIPVAEAFGFSAEMRKRTSGSANPQLIFAGFETLDQDPFWVPTTEEELEDLGELAERENLALSYVTQIRKRKGMSVDEKLVKRGEQQRTMKK